MNRFKQICLALATAGVLTSGIAHAALHDRGGGLLYDDVLNVTWLQDATYAKTSGYDADGRMNCTGAKTWASSLNISRFAGESLTGWRLAANTPVGAYWSHGWSHDGSTDYACNITSPHSEMSYMYYVNLGLEGELSSSGVKQGDFGIFRNGTWGGQANVGLVKNLQGGGGYWSGTTYAPGPASSAWFFDTSDRQALTGQGSEFYAWAVRPGDVAVAVPEPETYAMLMAGLGLLAVVAKRRRRSFDAS